MNANIEKESLIKKSDYEDRRLSYFIISYYFTQILNLTVKNILPIPEHLYPIVSIMFGIILVIFFAMSIKIIFRRSLITFVCSEFAFIALFAISFLMGNAESSLLLNNVVWAIIICVPLGVYVYSIKNKEIFYDLFTKSSIFMTIILSLVLFFPINDSSYNMSFSYALLVPAIFHINEWYKNRKKLYLIIFIFEIIAILVYGSRGALLSIAFFFVLKFILNKKNLVRKISIISIISIVFILVYFNFDRIGIALLGYLADKGYYSRTLTLLFSNRISYDSGRLELFKYYFDLIGQKPIIGWGVLGGWLPDGYSPHNMIIEILLAFGIIIGGIIIFSLIMSQFRVFYVKDKNTRDLLIIYMSRIIGLFFISGNILINPNFFIFTYLVLGSFRYNSLMEREKV